MAQTNLKKDDFCSYNQSAAPFDFQSKQAKLRLENFVQFHLLILDLQ